MTKQIHSQRHIDTYLQSCIHIHTGTYARIHTHTLSEGSANGSPLSLTPSNNTNEFYS